MSSIIKALKKLDDDAPRPNETVYRNQNVNIRRAVLGRAKRSVAYQKWLMIFLVASAVVGVGWMVFPMKSGKDPSGMIATRSTSRSIPRQPSSSVTMKPKEKSTYQAPTYWENSNSKSIEEPARTIPSTPPSVSSVQKPVDRKPLNQTPPTPSEKTPEPISEPPVALTVESPASLNPEMIPVNDGTQLTSEPPKTTSEEDAELAAFNLGPPPESKSHLDLQALVWSDDAANRFAVIDGRILKENQSFEGVRLLKISWDSIVLEYEGRQWKLIQY